MLKITENFETANTVRLRLDGILSQDAIGELADAYLAHRDDVGRTVILDMAGVEFMNDHAARSLINMRNERLHIVNCSPFIATLLDTIARTELGQ
jgi:anti-anti-sigma regulatory factor